jgi:hypothetical protein
MKHFAKIQIEFIKIAGRSLNFRTVVQLKNGETGYTELPITSFNYLGEDVLIEVYFPEKKHKHSITFGSKKFVKSFLTVTGEYDKDAVRQQIKDIRFKHPKFEKMFINHVLDVMGNKPKMSMYEIMQKLVYGDPMRRWRFRGHDFKPLFEHAGFNIDDSGMVSQGNAVRQLGITDDWWQALNQAQQEAYLTEHPMSEKR